MTGVTDKHIRGVLLEEAVLHLLRRSGYRTVEVDEVDADATLVNHAAGLAVHGRGERHQIDAIADFCISPPFGHPLRLLLEAKCYTRKIGLPTVRNAVGVLKDVSEYWVIPPSDHGTRRQSPHRRYHYQYAVFASSGYTKDAQRYAFAQDIFLIPLAHSTFFLPILGAINAVTTASFGVQANSGGFLGQLRLAVRNALRNEKIAAELDPNGVLIPPVIALLAAVRQIGTAYLAVVGGYLPIFLVPSPEWKARIERANQVLQVTVTFDDNGWYINEADERIFSFDLPAEIAGMYRENGILTAQGALNLKRELFKSIEIFDSQGEVPRIFWLKINTDWLDQVGERYRNRAF